MNSSRIPPKRVKTKKLNANVDTTSVNPNAAYDDLSNHATEVMGETGLFCNCSVNYVHPPFFFLFPYLPLTFLLTLLPSSNVNDEGADGAQHKP